VRSPKGIEKSRKVLKEFPFIRTEVLNHAVVICHRFADVDAYCAAYGVAFTLRKLKRGIKVSIYTPDGISNPVKKLLEKYPFRLYKKKDFKDIDLLVVVDTGHISLLGTAKEQFIKSNCFKIFLDHHPINNSIKDSADYVIVDVTTSSTSEIIFELFNSLNLRWNKKIAQVLLTGILFDSQNLQLADHRTIEVIEQLYRKGATIRNTAELMNRSRERAERIARLKGSKRTSLYNLGDWIIGITEVGSYHATVARSLIELGADLSVVLGKKDEGIRGCLRATQPFVENLKIHVGVDIAEKISLDLDGIGGGHPNAASFNINSTSKIIIRKIQEIIQETSSLKLKSIRI